MFHVNINFGGIGWKTNLPALYSFSLKSWGFVLEKFSSNQIVWWYFEKCLAQAKGLVPFNQTSNLKVLLQLTEHQFWKVFIGQTFVCINCTGQFFLAHLQWTTFYALLQLTTFYALLQLLTFACTTAIDNFLCTTAIVNFQMHFYNCQHFMEYGKWNLLYEQLHLRTFVCIIVFQCFYVPSNRYLLYAQLNLIPFCPFGIDKFLCTFVIEDLCIHYNNC